MAVVNTTVTITFGEVAENHIGNQQIGDGRAEHGFSVAELEEIKRKVDTLGDPRYVAEIVRLNDVIPGVDVEEAAVLVIRNGVNMLIEKAGKTTDDMLREQLALEPDKKYWDTRNQRVQNKRARHNLCFAEENQEADYETGKGTIIAFRDVECVQVMREELGELCGERGANLNAEGNYYYDPKKTGIGFHGDTERKIVIAARLGPSIPLHYQWFHRFEPVGERIKLTLGHGDFYIMSEKATGYDWRRSSIMTLRHAAGAEQHLKIRKKKATPKAATANVPVQAPQLVLAIQTAPIIIAPTIVLPVEVQEEPKKVVPVVNVKLVELIPIDLKPVETNGTCAEFSAMLLEMAPLPAVPGFPTKNVGKV